MLPLTLLRSADISSRKISGEVVASRGGKAAISHDLQDEAHVCSLIYKDSCCEQGLVNLLLLGLARNSVSDHGWSDVVGLRADIGFLTTQDGYIVGDLLKCPKAPFWVLLAGGHYTMMWSQSPLSLQKESKFTKPTNMVHYNGFLHNQAKTRLSNLALIPHTSSDGGDRKEAAAGDSEEINALKIKLIVDYKPAIGGNKRDGPFLFCVACEKGGSMEATARDVSRKWRCRDCTLQKPPVWSAYNDGSAEMCKECKTHVRDCGVCVWVRRNQLPAGLRSIWEKDHASPILKLVQTKWYRATIELPEGCKPPVCWG